MKKFKVFLVLLLSIAIIAMSSIVIFAEDEVVEDAPEVVEEVDPTEAWLDSIRAIAETAAEPKVEYTFESIYKGGITLEPFADAFSKTLGFNIVTDLPFGYVIYDDPTTEFIDGLRVNGMNVCSKRIYLAPEDLAEIVVQVKIVYADGFAGSIAQIVDGTYDWTNLLTNPISILMLLYYGISLITLLVSLVYVPKRKRKSEQASETLVDKVWSRVQADNSQFKQELLNNFNDALNTTLIPVAQHFTSTAGDIITAIISENGTPEGALTALEALKRNASTDVNQAIEAAKAAITKTVKADAEHKVEVLSSLKNIYKGDSENAPIQEDVKPEPEPEQISIF